jgi:hypothetical protein
MTGSRRHVAVIAVSIAMVVAVVGAAGVTAHAPDPVLGGGLWAQNRVLEFRWRSGAEPPADIKLAIRRAADDLTATRASKAATFAYVAGGDSPIGYGAGATCGVNGLACFTRSVPDGFTMWLREQGHVFDWGTLRWCQMYSSPPNGCYDAETIALDEFGHIEGLGHHANYSDDRDYLDAVVQTLSRTRPSAGWNMHVLGRCDVATLQREYDVASSSTLYSTCLDIDTVLTLTRNPASVPYGGTTTLTAALEVVDRDEYERLGGNPVSNRSIRLQRRTAGTTTWVNIGSMTQTATAGTYTMAVRLTATADFRAMFLEPTNEGLDDDTSPTVTVTVGPCTSACPQSIASRTTGR